MNFKTVKKFTAELGWGYLATSDRKKVGVRPMGSCVWVDNELWCATSAGTEKIPQLRKVPFAEYCFMNEKGRHVRIAGPCTISNNNGDKLKLYEAVPALKKYYKNPSAPEYVVIRMKPKRILAMAKTGKGYENIEVPK